MAEGRHPVELQQRGVYYEGTRARDQHICHQIMIAQAGEAAQRIFCLESLQDFQASFDRRRVKALIRKWDRFASVAEQAAKVDALHAHTGELLTTPLCAAAMHAIAARLIERKQISGDAFRAELGRAFNETKKVAKAAGDPQIKIECPHCAEYPEEW